METGQTNLTLPGVTWRRMMMRTLVQRRCLYLYDVAGVGVAGVEGLLVWDKARYLRLLHLLPSESEDPGLLHEAEDEGVVQRGVLA